MKQIKFYISNIDPNLLSSICGRPGELISLARSGKYINEEALASKLYDGKWSYQNFLNLKSRTKKILEAYFLISPSKKDNEILKKIQESRKSYVLAMQLIERAERAEAKKLLLQAFNTAIEYGFTRIAYNSAVELMAGASLERKASRFQYYEGLIEQLEIDLKAERKAHQYYYKAILQMNAQRGFGKKEVVADQLKELETFSCTSVRFLQHFYTLHIIEDLQRMDYPNVKQSAGKALELLRYKKGAYRSHLQLFTRVKAIAHTTLCEYKQAKELYTEAEQYSALRSYNRGILHYYQAINALHSKDYQGAYELYRQHRKTKFAILAEQWSIMAAYMYFLKKLGKLDTGNDRFSLGKYLNETIEIAHDKTGNNVNVLIGELLVNLVKNRGKFIDRVEAVNSYSYKYLKGEETKRAKWFIRLLCMMPRANFHPVALERMAKRQIDNLKKYPVYMGDNLSVEIIPFGDLWEMIAERLKERVA